MRGLRKKIVIPEKVLEDRKIPSFHIFPNESDEVEHKETIHLFVLKS